MSEELTGAAPSAAAHSPIVEALTPPAPTPVEVVETPKPSIEDTMGAVWDKLHPPRAGDGKFAAKDGAETAAPDAATETTDQPETAAPEPATPAIEAPHAWSAEMKAKFGQLPPDAQNYIAQRESEAHKAITSMGQRVQAFEPVRNVLERYDGLFRANGVSHEVGLSNLMTAAAALQNDAPGAIRAIAAQHGVDLRTLAGLEQGEAAATPENAQVRSLQAELHALKRQIAETSHRLTSREAQEAEVRQSTLQSVVEKFASDKPHWAEIEEEIFSEIHALRASQSSASLAPEDLLTKAYDRAMKVTGKAEEVQRRAAEAKIAEEAKKRASEAKRAGSINVKSTQGSAPGVGRTMEETMRMVADRVMG